MKYCKFLLTFFIANFSFAENNIKEIRYDIDWLANNEVITFLNLHEDQSSNIIGATAEIRILKGSSPKAIIEELTFEPISCDKITTELASSQSILNYCMQASDSSNSTYILTYSDKQDKGYREVNLISKVEIANWAPSIVNTMCSQSIYY